MNNRVNHLFRTGKRQNLFNMFNRKKQNRNAIWASLFGLGLSAAAMALRKNGSQNMKNSIQNLTNNVRSRNYGQMTNMANAIMEFSKELAPHKKPSTTEQNKQ